ncbi:hypothetical protein DPM19_30615 [Actinomadura craniellae]|uniref:Alpha/beta hydrolase n=1 Tax=Actinomadura craniellae TaxID=2231787 RepID=A0A365GX30_9ACTN|nr:hypothetical protein DPM19_30615 [Actinomadura craniellae]
MLAAIAVGAALLVPRTVAIARAAGTVPHRGMLVTVHPLGTLTADQVRTALTGAGFDTGSVRYDVDAYRLVYRTADTRNRPVTASGLFVLPRSGERRLHTVSLARGTAIHRADMPAEGWDRGPALGYAAAGFAAVTPDHPGTNAPAETTASLDMLRAARDHALRSGRQLDRQVFVTGLSQGATAAQGLARVLRDGADPWFRLRAVVLESDRPTGSDIVRQFATLS